MFKFIIIADDFTGANDTGVQLTKKGFETYTLLDLEGFTKSEFDALVIDTETRGLSPENAYNKVKESINKLKALINVELEEMIIYKKIDSTLRR
ncbi:four-carbon acid sugar kinase family protein [Thermovenabulum sp.]|uniref:four-carbon acid sugar kinase family protein n=1 Tax=Thermovenabulum sp. TaxID=3100335 RepID=UPI003C79B791